MSHILLLEDDENLNRGISFKLQKEGYQVCSCGSMSDGHKLFHSHDIDLIICDIGLEDGSGLDFCRQIRAVSNVRFIFLTALDTEVDIVMGYEAGADDYITKPFSLSVLLSKVQAIYRRLHTGSSDTICSGDLKFLKNEMKLFKNGSEIPLSRNELRLLLTFLEHPKQVLTKNVLLESLWDIDGNFVDENAIAVNISRLRSKVEADPASPRYIRNIRGIGYLWDADCRKE